MYRQRHVPPATMQTKKVPVMRKTRKSSFLTSIEDEESGGSELWTNSKQKNYVRAVNADPLQSVTLTNMELHELIEIFNLVSLSPIVFFFTLITLHYYIVVLFCSQKDLSPIVSKIKVGCDVQVLFPYIYVSTILNLKKHILFFIFFFFFLLINVQYFL